MFEYDDILLRINQATKMKFGREYFTELGAIIVDLVKPDYTFLTKIDRNYNNAHPIVSFKGDALIPNIDYPLTDTPCLTVTDTCVGFYPENVQKLFPKDHYLVDLDIEGYIGVSIVPHGNEEPIGIITCLYEDKSDFSKDYLRTIELIASMIKGRIEREILLHENQLILEAKQAQEKELKYTKSLLREIHHRLKNNLHIIAGMLKLQGLESGDPVLQFQLDQTAERIRSLALIHEKIYSNENLDAVSLQEYLTDLISAIVTGNSGGQPITTQVHSEDFLFRPDPLAMLGMIINELVINSLKYAFNQKNASNSIQVDVQIKNNQLEVKYHDNGNWVENTGKKKTLGSNLIDIFTQQLEGNFETNTTNGTTYTFTFPREKVMLESLY